MREIPGRIATTHDGHFLLEIDECFENALLTVQDRECARCLIRRCDLGLSLAVVTETGRFQDGWDAEIG